MTLSPLALLLAVSASASSQQGGPKPLAPLPALTAQVPVAAIPVPGPENPGALPQARMTNVLPTAFDGAKIPKNVKLPDYLVAAQVEHAPWLSRVVAAAERSPTARKVLKDAKALAAKQGGPIVVAVGQPREWAAFDFDTHVLWMPRGALRKSAKHGATALAHELRHAVQLGSGLPDMFELELDAYMIDFQVAEELGDQALPGTYDASARAAFKRGSESFVRFLRKYYKADVARSGRGREYRKELQESLEAGRLARDRAALVLEQREAVLKAMELAGYPEAQLDAYLAESIYPARRRHSAAQRMVAWAERDLALHDDPATRKRTSDFARRTVRKLKRRSDAAFQKER